MDMAKPKIRFKGYTDDWEQRKLSELSDFITKGATPTTYGYDWQESGIPFFRNDAIKDNQFIYGDFSYISEEANEALQRSEIHGDDILVAITGDIGKAGIVPKSIEKGNINQHTARVRIIKDAIPYFVYQFLITDEQQKKYQLIKTGLSMPQLSLQQIRDTIVLCPSVEEQSMIGECFINLDHLITLHQRKCEETKKLKKYMLQKMFPQNDQKVPEIRFEGFTDDWEQRKVSEITSSYSGGTPKAGTTEYYDGDIPFIRSGEIYGDTTELFITEEGLNSSSAKMVHIGDILYALYGATSGEVSRAKLDGAINQAVLAIIPNDEVNADFLVEWFRKEKAQITDKYLQGGQGNLSAQIIKDLKVTIPMREEQNKIGEYFSKVNHLITLHQQKCDELKNIKKFMFQNMFI